MMSRTNLASAVPATSGESCRVRNADHGIVGARNGPRCGPYKTEFGPSYNSALVGSALADAGSTIRIARPASAKADPTIGYSDSFSLVLGGEGWGEGQLGEGRSLSNGPSPCPLPRVRERRFARLHHFPPPRIVQIFALLFVVVAPAFCRAGEDAMLPAGVKAVWDIGKVGHVSTATRETICLNGLWRWQPASAQPVAIPSADWGYAKVPGPWPGSHGDYTWVDSQTFYPAPAWKNENLGGVNQAWYQRGITIPAAWKGRRIALSIEYLNSAAAVYVDGKEAGKAFFPGGEVDLTSAVTPGSKHLLSLQVVAAPLSDDAVYFGENGLGPQKKATVGLRGLCGDVYLTSTPAAARLDDLKIETSVRKSQLTLSAAPRDLDANRSYRLTATISDAGRIVHEAKSEPFKASDLRDGRFSFSVNWKPEKLWDINTPENKFDVALSLVDDRDAVVDALPAARFGFREYWIDGRVFRLNGSPFIYSPFRSTARRSAPPPLHMKARARRCSPAQIARRQSRLHA